LLCILVAFIFATGCEPPPRPPLGRNRPKSETRAQQPSEPEFKPVESTNDDFALRFVTDEQADFWEAFFLGGQQFGYRHVQAEFTPRSDEVRYTVRSRIQYQAGDQLADEQLVETSVESTTGRLKNFRAELISGSRQETTEGKVNNKRLELTVSGDSDPQQRLIEWKSTFGGRLALHQHLLENPMKKGDKRQLMALAPNYEVGELKLEAIGMASVEMLDGSNKTLLEIESRAAIPEQPASTMTLWADEKGIIWKQFIPETGMIIMRVDQEMATRYFNPQQKMLQMVNVPLDREIPNHQDLELAGYLVSPIGEVDLKEYFRAQPGQQVRVTEDGGLQIAVDLDSQEGDAAVAGEGDRRRGPWVQSDDPRVVMMAQQVKAASKAEMAQNLAILVHQHFGDAQPDIEFDSAALSVASGVGDSTEYAVLLTALCRAKGIPARTAAGLVYQLTPEGPAMRYHMWTLALIGDRWVHLDATRRDGTAAADRIVLTTDDLAGGPKLAELEKFLTAVGKFEIKVGKTVPAAATGSDQEQETEAEPMPVEIAAPQSEQDAASTLERLLDGIDND
jgi:hypothetical protein